MAGDIAGRYHIVDNPNLHPGVDFFNRSATGPVLDTGVTLELDPIVVYDLNDPRGRQQIEIRERVYINEQTVLEFAQCFGIELRDEDEINEAYENGYSQALRDQLAKKELDVSDDARLADRVEQLLAALGSTEPAGVDPAEEPAEVTVGDHLADDGLGGSSDGSRSLK